MYSIVALRTFVLAFVSNKLLPKRRKIGPGDYQYFL